MHLIKNDLMGKFSKFYLIQVIIVILSINSCEKTNVNEINNKEKEIIPENKLPHCSISGINNGDTIVKGVDVLIKLDTRDTDGSIDSVLLIINEEILPWYIGRYIRVL